MFDKELNSQLETYFSQRPEIVAVFLFGSRARGEERDDSDVDFGILLRPESASPAVNRSELITDLMRLCQRSDVDAVILNDSSPLLLHRVLRDGHVLYAADDKTVAEFTIGAFQQYEDTRPLRELQAKRLQRRLLELSPKRGESP